MVAIDREYDGLETFPRARIRRQLPTIYAVERSARLHDPVRTQDSVCKLGSLTARINRLRALGACAT